MALPVDFDRYESASDRGKDLIELELKRSYKRERERYYLNLIGLGLGFLVVVFFGSLSGWLINGDHEVSGTIIGTVDLGALASLFVWGGSLSRQLPPGGELTPGPPAPHELPPLAP